MRTSILTLMVIVANPVAQAATSSEYIEKHAVNIPGSLPPQLFSAIDGKRLVLLGEVHGTNELPGLGLQVITKLAEKKPLLVGLEFPMEIQPQIDQFMKTGDVKILKGTKFFTDAEYHSGRGSVAMVNLLVSLRDLPLVSVFCFDIPFGFNGHNRDTEMARNILAIASQQPDQSILIYTGNIHSRLTPGAPWDPDFKTMGAEILSLSEGRFTLQNSASIYLRYDQGSAWQCIQESSKIVCGERSFGPGNSVYATAVPFDSYFLTEPGLTDGHQYTLFIRAVSASQPF